MMGHVGSHPAQLRGIHISMAEGTLSQIRVVFNMTTDAQAIHGTLITHGMSFQPALVWLNERILHDHVRMALCASSSGIAGFNPVRISVACGASVIASELLDV
jgi:hypothetical protein